ncbi:MAG TPA: cupin domain-containing protein [Myxococcaceae bacterium]|nr:cupin domain-containing protein [Myxococcaceae bacterium]HZA49554.1 cupin domain-containing protein [Myxococcaceae bacterium]
MSSSGRRHPNVVNVEELEPRAMSKGSRFACTTRRLGFESGGRGIGCSWYEIQPGRTAFPAHYHCANEEAVFVLEGEGTLRVGQANVALRAGDYVTLPPGPDHAHQIVNTGSAPLRYLALSTLHTTEVVGYPDSGKIGVMAAATPEAMLKPWVREIFRQDTHVDYYEGEKTD